MIKHFRKNKWTVQARIVLTILMSIIIFSACEVNEKDTETPTENEPVVYNAGFIAGYMGTTYAHYWKGTEKIDITKNQQPSKAYSIFLDDNNNIYVAGTRKNSKYQDQPVYWKNNQEFLIKEETEYGCLNAIAFHNDNLYLAGYYTYPDQSQVTAYWINGVEYPLSGLDNKPKVSDIYIQGKDVYIAGFDSKSNAIIWKNQQATQLNETGTAAAAHDVFVTGEDVYVAGFENNSENISEAVFWKNGNKTILSDGISHAQATSIFIDNSGIYITGCIYDDQNKPQAVCWKNKELIFLSSEGEYSQTEDIIVKEDDIYIAGYKYNGENYVAVYWKNGTEKTLSDGTSHALNYSIALK